MGLRLGPLVCRVALSMILDTALDQRANVYTGASGTGRYTVLAKSNLSCRLMHLNIRLVPTAIDRAELSAMRDMMFDPDYVMPEQCQVEVDGIRWQPKPGTFGAFRDWNSNVVYRNCQVLRQQGNASF